MCKSWAPPAMLSYMGTSPPSSHLGAQWNYGRIVGFPLLLLSTIGLASGICISFSLEWLGLPRTTNLGRTMILLSFSIVLGPVGYRLASGVWRGCWQALHRAAAVGAVFFFGYAAKQMLLNAAHPHLPPLWILATAGLALVSWCMVASRSRVRDK